MTSLSGGLDSGQWTVDSGDVTYSMGHPVCDGGVGVVGQWQEEQCMYLNG